MPKSDLPNYIDTHLSHMWLIIPLAIAIGCIAALFVVAIKDLEPKIAVLLALIAASAAGVWGVSLSNINENQQSTAIRAWIAQTYVIDESVTGGNVVSDFTLSGGEAAVIVDDQGRALTLVVTVDDRLVLVDAGGRELPRIDAS